MLNKRLLLFVLSGMILMVVLLTGCFGNKQTSSQEPAVQGFLTMQDSIGRNVTLPKKPERIVVLSTSFLDLLYAVDGKAVGRPSSKTDAVPQSAANVPEVGFVYNINLEKVIALQPDLVIAVQGMHDKLIPALESNHIQVIVLKYKTLEDTLDTIKLLGKIAGTPAKAEQLITTMQEQIQGITAKLPAGKTTKVAILHATAKSVTVELERTIAGSIAQKLGLANIAAGTVPIDKDGDNVPYSLERLVESDPDVVLVVTMGDAAEIKKRMTADVESNPAWASLRAVKDHKTYYLPADLFLLNPGLKMPDAVSYLAKIIYPDVYDSVK